ncbi:hypothetical protein BD413DRAFT_518972 [Trametes elegans]|nr:hypothetical protein BD413DRAFT_518972 [Trametes elegans]
MPQLATPTTLFVRICGAVCRQLQHTLLGVAPTYPDHSHRSAGRRHASPAHDTRMQGRQATLQACQRWYVLLLFSSSRLSDGSPTVNGKIG